MKARYEEIDSLVSGGEDSLKILTAPPLEVVKCLHESFGGGGHSDSLTMAIMTEAYPMPPGVHQPGIPSTQPFYMDHTWVFTATVQNYR